MLRASERVRLHPQNQRVGVVRNNIQTRTVCLKKTSSDNRERGLMFLILFIVLLVIWLLGWAAFHIAGGLIHLLLIIAVISLVLHFFRRRPA
jgi:Flp pilus assembly protein TadB